MLSSITPLGERGRGRAFGPTATAYVVGSVGGASLLGAGLGTLGSALPDRLQLGAPAGWAVIAVGALLGVLADARFRGAALPTIRRQVNENWLSEFRGVVIGAGFGFQLGLGVVTIVTSSLIYLMWLVALLTGSAGAGLAIGAAFGAARAVPILAVRGVQRPDQLAHAHRRMAALAAPAHRAALAFTALLAVVAAAAGVTA